MKMCSVVPMWIAKAGYIVMSIIFCVAGVLFIALPEWSSGVLGLGLGIGLILFGAVKLVGYFSKDLFRLAFQYDLGFGILWLVLGVLTLLRPNNVLYFICIALGISTLADGLFKVQIAMDSRRFGIKSWWVILILALVAGLAGLVLIFRPAESVKLLTILLGVCLLSDGILSLCVSLLTVKIVRHQRPDIIDADE